jgi:glutaryl-CoA dehydrogenase
MTSRQDTVRRRQVGESQTQTAGSADLLLLDELLTEEELRIRSRVREFCDRAVVPIINDYWERGEFPLHLVSEMAELRLAGGVVKGYGCPGISSVAQGLVAAEMARADGSMRDFFSVQDLAILTIDMLGSDEQRQHWIPPLATMERIGAFAMTEPRHGSDASSLETRATEDGKDYVLNGRKRWITNGTIAETLVVWARDEAGEVGGFVVEPPVSGWEAVRMTGKTACRAADHAEIRLSDVRIPRENRLERSRSFADTSRVLLRSRQGVAWEALGHALGAYEAALAHVLGREQFGRPLAASQLVQDRLASMLIDVTTTSLMCWRVARLDQDGRATAAMASAVKLHAASAARRVVLAARDLIGGNGLLLANHVARHHADVEATYTYEGTHTINALILGRAVTGFSAFSQ